jgi:cell division protein FtsB
MSKRQTSADGRFRRVAPSERRGLPYGKWIATAAVTLLLTLVALFGSGGWVVARQEAAAVAALDAELATVETDLNDIKLRTGALLEPGGFELERVAREEYLMRADGDEVIHLVPAPEGAESPNRSR